MRITPDQLTKSLEAQGIRPETLKARIRADMVWSNLVRGRYKESLQIGEKEVAAAAQESGDEKAETQGFEYKMQPVVLVVPRGSAPDVDRGAQEGSRGFARAHPDLRRGKLVLQIDAERRDTRDRGQNLGRHAGCTPRDPRQHADRPLTPPEVTKQGVEMVVLCARKPTTVDTPKKREIRDKMYRREIRGEVEIVSAASSAGPR